MFHRGPIVMTTLEEDFKKIGLIAEKSAKVEAAEENEQLDEQVEETEQETDEVAEEDGAEDGEELDEAGRRRRVTIAGSRRLGTTKRTPMAKRMKSKRSYRKKKMKIKLSRRKAMRSPRRRRRAKLLAKRASQRRGESNNSPISNLIEEVQSIVAQTEGNTHAEAMKGFANIAIISDLLSTTFVEWAEADDVVEDQDTYDTLIEFAETLSDLAEAASEMASGLNEGKEPEEGSPSIEELFKEYMADMLEGMEIYNSIAETDTEHGKAGNVGQPNAIKKKGKVTTTVGEADEDDDEEGEEGDEEDEEGEDDDEDAEESKRPSKR